MNTARIIEPADIAAALWVAHEYEKARHALLCSLSTEKLRAEDADKVSPAALAAQKRRCDAAATAMVAATEYANCFAQSESRSEDRISHRELKRREAAGER